MVTIFHDRLLRWVAGFERTKRDVIRVVHIGASTLAKRVNEFAGTSASEYTADDFEVGALFQ